ncbi:MAG: hypothetical protein MZU79_06520 [Anaerotruncus sp.]|nr:hypothetical protein [Anaerotruncus sp.]
MGRFPRDAQTSTTAFSREVLIFCLGSGAVPSGAVLHWEAHWQGRGESPDRRVAPG